MLHSMNLHVGLILGLFLVGCATAETETGGGPSTGGSSNDGGSPGNGGASNDGGAGQGGDPTNTVTNTVTNTATVATNTTTSSGGCDELTCFAMCAPMQQIGMCVGGVCECQDFMQGGFGGGFPTGGFGGAP